jgi:hypothetical protein
MVHTWKLSYQDQGFIPACGRTNFSLLIRSYHAVLIVVTKRMTPRLSVTSSTPQPLRQVCPWHSIGWTVSYRIRNSGSGRCPCRLMETSRKTWFWGRGRLYLSALTGIYLLHCNILCDRSYLANARDDRPRYLHLPFGWNTSDCEAYAGGTISQTLLILPHTSKDLRQLRGMGAYRKIASIWCHSGLQPHAANIAIQCHSSMKHPFSLWGNPPETILSTCTKFPPAGHSRTYNFYFSLIYLAKTCTPPPPAFRIQPNVFVSFSS